MWVPFPHGSVCHPLRVRPKDTPARFTCALYRSGNGLWATGPKPIDKLLHFVVERIRYGQRPVAVEPPRCLGQIECHACRLWPLSQTFDRSPDRFDPLLEEVLPDDPAFTSEYLDLQSVALAAYLGWDVHHAVMVNPQFSNWRLMIGRKGLEDLEGHR